MMTGVGTILGTAAYMAPERAKGKPADTRSDLWAFGCVLYEMLTGTRLFEGEDVTDVLVAVLTKQPNWAALPPNTPPAIRTLSRRCLEKDRKRRLDSAAAAHLEIDDALTTPAMDATAPSGKPVTRGTLRVGEDWSPPLGWIAAAVLSIALFALAIPVAIHFRETPPPPSPSVRFQIRPPGTTAAGMFTLSADGRQLAFVTAASGASQLWLRDLETLEPRALPGTDGATYPFWSRSLLFLHALLRSSSKPC